MQTAINKVAGLNDEFRRHGFRVTITRGVQALEDVAGLLRDVREFNSFTQGNDPHGEHDFGSIVWGDATVLWKIDYYDQALRGWEDPMSRHCWRGRPVML